MSADERLRVAMSALVKDKSTDDLIDILVSKIEWDQEFYESIKSEILKRSQQ